MDDGHATASLGNDRRAESTITDRIARIECAHLEGKRPRPCGKNARLGAHGSTVRVPLCRITTASGAHGIGLARVTPELAHAAIGRRISEIFDIDQGTADHWMPLDYALFDLAGRVAGLPVWRLLSGTAGTQPNSDPKVACYDTSLYFDDLAADVPQADHAGAAAIIAANAARSYEHGHRAFKVKVGRGARWMPTADGLERDIAVVRAVRDAIGPTCQLFADANNGYTLNIAKQFLEETASAGVGWIEEPFHEDPVLLDELQSWLEAQRLHVLVADGETASSSEAYALAAQHRIDLVQCDILRLSFTGWLRLGQALDSVGAASAPHHFGHHLGNLLSGHLTAKVKNLAYVEWDDAKTTGINAPGYRLLDGRIQLSDDPGFGIDIDSNVFAAAVRASGFDLHLRDKPP